MEQEEEEEEEVQSPEERQREDAYIDALLYAVPIVLIFGLYAAARVEYYHLYEEVHTTVTGELTHSLANQPAGEPCHYATLSTPIDLYHSLIHSFNGGVPVYFYSHAQSLSISLSLPIKSYALITTLSLSH